MDEQQIYDLIKRCRHIKYKCKGVYPSDFFPLPMRHDTFAIVNASTSKSLGTHWVLIANLMGKMYFADPLGLHISFYPNILKRLKTQNVQQVLYHKPLQSPTSKMCGLFCIYIAHYLMSYKFSFPLIDEVQLSSFERHMMSK